MIFHFRVRKLIFLPFCLFSLFSGISQEYDSLALSDHLFSTLESERFAPEKQLLTPASQMRFPYNIIVRFPAAAQSQAEAGTETETELVFAVPQEIAAATEPRLIELMDQLRQVPLPVKTTILLQAGDFSRLPSDSFHDTPAGTGAYIAAAENPASTAVILLSPAGTSAAEAAKVMVVPGADGVMTPLWLLRRIPLNIDQNSVLPYRLNLAETDRRLEAFLKAGFDAAAVRFSADNDRQSAAVYAALLQLAGTFSAEDSDSDMRNYILVPFTSDVWISERTVVLFYIISIAVVLFFVSSFSLFGKNRAQTRKDFKQTWYLIPITVLVSAASLSLGQFFTEKLLYFAEVTPVTVIMLKTGFSFLFVSLLFIAQVHFRLPVSPFVYGFLLTLVSILNIFIFTTIDISFLFIFIIEYLIIYVTRLARRLVPLVISSVMMLLPFIPYIAFLTVSASPQKIAYLAQPDFAGNVLLACALIPFQIMWLRILVRMNMFGKTRNISGFKIAAVTVTAVAAVAAVGTGMLFTVSYAARKTVPAASAERSAPAVQTPFTVTSESPERPSSVVCSASADVFMDLMNVRLEIDSELPIVRADVTVSAQTEVPVYDSEIPFQTVSARIPGTILFTMPEYPSLPAVFSYVTDAALDQHIGITCYVRTGTDEVVKTDKTLTVKAALK